MKTYTYNYPKPSVTTDCIIIRKVVDNNQVLLIKRRDNPFAGKWALPGGFVEDDEDLEDGAIRELKEETGLTNVELHQFRTYGTPGRDPRGHTISVVYYGIIKNNSIEMTAGDDAEEAAWFDINHLPPLAFDHDQILNDFENRK